MTDLLISRTALISDCGRYRYRLERGFPRAGRIAAVIMVNPSLADAKRDDQTIRKLYGFADRLGISRFIVGNKFGIRATDVGEVAQARDPIGPDNDRHLEAIMEEADLHIVAWGALSKLPRRLRDRWRAVAKIADRVGAQLMCLGTASDGHPLHPMTLAYDRPLVRWERPQ